MKKVAVLYSEYTPLVDALRYHLSDCSTEILTSVKNADEYDLIICTGNTKSEGNAITCHHSLLPAFECEEPEKEAILNGAKVTGITIYYINTKKIITQYPVFINNDTHYNDLKQELTYLEQIILPLVAEKILNNEPFDIQKLINKGCGRNCGGCSSCSH